MSTEDEKWRENFAQNEGQEYNREGYKPYNRDNNRMYNNRNSYGDRQQRPYSGRSGYNNRNGYNKNGYQPYLSTMKDTSTLAQSATDASLISINNFSIL